MPKMSPPGTSGTLLVSDFSDFFLEPFSLLESAPFFGADSAGGAARTAKPQMAVAYNNRTKKPRCLRASPTIHFPCRAPISIDAPARHDMRGSFAVSLVQFLQ